MEQCMMFGNAKWVCAGNYTEKSAKKPDPNGIPHFPILRRDFSVTNVRKATLRVLGLGFFYCYINGKKISDDAFLPLSTDYEPRTNYPVDEKLTGHRIYVPEYDVTDFLENGKNALSIHFGGGWYTFDGGRFGDPKAIYRLTVETASGTFEFLSSEEDKIGDSYVKTYYLTTFEAQDYNGFDPTVFTTEFDASAWPNAQTAVPVETDYLCCDCPADRVQEQLTATCIHQTAEEKIYDTGRNCSSYPVLRVWAPKGESVTVLFSEQCNPDGTLNMDRHWWQRFSYVSDGTERIVQPEFTWFAYRYFSVVGNAEPLHVNVIHTNVTVDSAFTSDNETLNWLYDAYMNTQLSNMHAGIPSDCPHIERRGYTGDGQLACHAVMNVMDAKSFYHKWIGDISDCQDIYSGHIQYTAPYLHSGGGPGGWGCAIIEVPYQYYKHYGDTEPLKRLYHQMLRYFDYLESHSENLLVTSDKKGEWCLGDWCPPIQVVIPAPFVNNYFYVKSLTRMIEIAKLVGRESDIPMFEKRIVDRKEAIRSAYYNCWDSNFVGNLQGANAFAIDIGLGNETTYQNLVDYYKKLGGYDTGIFGTDVVTRVLFEHGDGELAIQLMASQNAISFEGMRRAGATTIWEYWPEAIHSRSENHPMFGAVTAYLFDYILGIRAKDETAAYQSIVIAPVFSAVLNRVSGQRQIPSGTVSVSYEKSGETVSLKIIIPENQPSVFQHGETVITLKPGLNQFEITI